MPMQSQTVHMDFFPRGSARVETPPLAMRPQNRSASRPTMGHRNAQSKFAGVANSPPRQRAGGGPFEMGAHARRRGRLVALEDRLGDGAVLLNRVLEHGWRQDVADLGHDERQL